MVTAGNPKDDPTIYLRICRERSMCSRSPRHGFVWSDNISKLQYRQETIISRMISKMMIVESSRALEACKMLSSWITRAQNVQNYLCNFYFSVAIGQLV